MSASGFPVPGPRAHASSVSGVRPCAGAWFSARGLESVVASHVTREWSFRSCSDRIRSSLDASAASLRASCSSLVAICSFLIAIVSSSRFSAPTDSFWILRLGSSRIYHDHEWQVKKGKKQDNQQR